MAWVLLNNGHVSVSPTFLLKGHLFFFFYFIYTCTFEMYKIVRWNSTAVFFYFFVRVSCFRFCLIMCRLSKRLQEMWFTLKNDPLAHQKWNSQIFFSHFSSLSIDYRSGWARSFSQISELLILSSLRPCNIFLREQSFFRETKSLQVLWSVSGDKRLLHPTNTLALEFT